MIPEIASQLVAANETMRQTIDALAADPDLMTFMGRVLQIVGKQVGAPLVEYFSHEGARTVRLRLSCYNGVVVSGSDVPNDFRVRDFSIPEEWLLGAESVFLRRKHHLVDNVLEEPFTSALWARHGLDLASHCASRGVGKLLNVPLRVGEVSYGSLVFVVPLTYEFTPATIALLEVIARQVTLAIRLTELAEESKQVAVMREQERAARARAAELARANDQLQQNLLRLSEGGDVHTILGELLRSASGQLRALGAAAYRCEETPTLAVAVASRSSLEALFLDWPFAAWDAHPTPSRPVSRSDLVILDARVATDAEAFVDHAACRWTDEGAPIVCLLPIVVGSRSLGWMLLAFAADTNITAESRRIGQSIASLAAMAIETSRLTQRAQDAALAEERARLARELHDMLAGTFTGIATQLQRTAALPADEASRRDASLGHAEELARDGLRRLREFVSSLTLRDPGPPLTLGVMRALVASRTAGSSARGVFETEGRERPLKPGFAHALLRILQDAIGNAQLHAEASEIAVTLRFEQASVALVVRDDGKGFDVETTRDASFGLESIARRTMRLGGTPSIVSTRGMGTSVTILVPEPYADDASPGER